MSKLKAEPSQGFVSSTKLKNIHYPTHNGLDPSYRQRTHTELVADSAVESKALENPELDCWACENNVNILQIKTQRASFFRNDRKKEHRKYYCNSCGIWLAAYDSLNGWRLTDENTATITTAQREGLMPSKIPQIYEDRRNIRSITVLGKRGKVVVFNSTGTLSATSTAMYKNLERNLQWADAVELAADVAFEMMMQLRKSSPEGTDLDDFRGKYAYKNQGNISYRDAQLLVNEKWYYMFSKLGMSKQEMDYQKRLRFGVMGFFNTVGAWDAKWENHRQVWYELLLHLTKYHFGNPPAKYDAIHAYITVRRELQQLNLSAEQDEKRQAAVEIAMQYCSLIHDLKPWKKKKNNKVDVRGSMSEWWDGVLAEGTVHESFAEREKTVDRLAQEAEDWLDRVTPVTMIKYFIGKTMHGEQPSLINSCAHRQVCGILMENLRRIDIDESNKTYKFKKTNS